MADDEGTDPTGQDGSEAADADETAEKAEELREVFIDTTGTEEVTEQQEESPGSLADEAGDGERVRELIREMRDRYDFRTDLADDELATLAELFHDGVTDDEIAAELDVDTSTVFRARLDLQLVREEDRDAPFDLSELRSMIVDDVPPESRVERLAKGSEMALDRDTVDHYTSVIEADLDSTRANDRFRDEFAELLSDADLEQRLASDAREDGLAEATEDMETDVDL